MFAIAGIKPSHQYSLLIFIAEVLGFISVITVGLLFDKNIAVTTGVYASGLYDWEAYPFSYHPLMMTIGLLFCYGNAILLYRSFRHTDKYLLKCLHAAFLLGSLVFAAVGFAAIIKQKNKGKAPHFMTYHSWLGLATIILFVFQWVCGFLAFLIPSTPISVRKAYMPSHRLWGKSIFLSAVISILTGLSEHGFVTSFRIPGDLQQDRRLLINFGGVSIVLFTLIVIYLLANPDYQRPAEQSPPPQEPDQDLHYYSPANQIRPNVM